LTLKSFLCQLDDHPGPLLLKLLDATAGLWLIGWARWAERAKLEVAKGIRLCNL
jgi:hypothetical protein